MKTIVSVRNVCVLFIYEDPAENRVRFFDTLRMGLSSNFSDMKVGSAIDLALHEKHFSSAVDRSYVDNCNRTIESEIKPPCQIDASVTLYVIEKKNK